MFLSANRHPLRRNAAPAAMAMTIGSDRNSSCIMTSPASSGHSTMTYRIRRDAETVRTILNFRHVLHGHLNSHANRSVLT